MTDQPQLALDQVFGKIEPLTRFSRESLIRESEDVRITCGQAFWIFRIHMSNDKETGTGRLPSLASALESEDKLDEVAQQTVRAAYDAFPNRINTWLSTNARTDAELHPADCFNGPKHFGYEQTCSNCIGSGWIQCPNAECLLREYWILWKARGLGFVSTGLPLTISIICQRHGPDSIGSDPATERH